MSEYKLETATEAELKNVITWFHDQEELTQWGGPGLEYGLPLPAFAQQIRLAKVPSFCLLAGNKNCGFGQFYIRHGRHHFGRLAISPKERGKRLAYVLLQLLMERAEEQQSAKGFSLFVLEHNTPAIKTYQNFGFKFTEYPQAIPGGLESCRYMTLDKS